MHISQQLIRYAIVGFTTNGIAYLLYLLLTWLGIGHKSAMTLVYVTGILLSFFFNKRWTFDHAGAIPQSLIRYWLAYGMGYLLSLSAMFVFVDLLNLPHWAVQAALIFIVAIFLFTMQKYWVFARRDDTISSSLQRQRM